ncbi:MAG: hypothetical protein HC813_01410 [Planctomycetes bacterium]|nr:hypothetical protein [Planctomycetota bacterium]
MSEETKGPDMGDAAKKKAQELNQAVTKLGLPDRLIFLGAAACLVFWIFSWWSMSFMMQSKSISGMEGKYLLGWFAALATVLLCLVNMKFDPPPAGRRGGAESDHLPHHNRLLPAVRPPPLSHRSGGDPGDGARVDGCREHPLVLDRLRGRRRRPGRGDHEVPRLPAGQLSSFLQPAVRVRGGISFLG